MKLRLEADPGELETKALSAVRLVASQLAKYDDRLFVVAKALWKTDLEKAGAVVFQGLSIHIENPVGSTRHWKDAASGREGTTVMQHPYGYVKGTVGADGDGYDCFVGPNPDAPFVWIVHQARPDLGNTQQDARAIYDEDKALLGFDDVHSAVAAYQAHYDNPAFFGSMTQMEIAEFRSKVLATEGPAQDGMLKGEPRAGRATSQGEAKPRFVIPNPELSKAGLAQVFTEGTAVGGPSAVYTGVGGPNIAMGVPPRPENKVDTSSMSITSMHAAIEAAVVDRDEERKTAPRRDPKVYDVASLTELPLHPLPEWEQRMIAGEAARADAPANLQFVQDKLDRRSAFIREGHPEKLIPRDPRMKERYFIKPKNDTTTKADVISTPPDVRQDDELVRALEDLEAPLPEDKPAMRVAPSEPAKPEYKVPRTATVMKAELGAVTLNVVEDRFEVLIKGRVLKTFASLSAACDHVWVVEKGYRDVKHWREATGRRKVPSGAGWRFWGVDPSSVDIDPSGVDSEVRT